MRRFPLVALTVFAVAPSAAVAAPALPRLHAVDDPGRGDRIVDARGRQVLLRGVNVNALAAYWRGTRFRTTFPLWAGDPARMQAIGWNAVRLLLSWSRVEPRPGVYDARYLDRAASTVKRLERAGIYTILDMHQDAWGATLAARPHESCPAGAEPAIGWDGAPRWATIVPASVPRCFISQRELNPAVTHAWQLFLGDARGVQRDYAAMWGHVARRLARVGAVAGFDLMNEPNTFTAGDNRRLVAMYARARAAIRTGERAGRGFHHLILFEPSVLFSAIGSGAPPRWTRDPNVVYAPHIYTGGFDGGPITRAAFAEVRSEARKLGGVPVVVGEWGTDPARAGVAGDYFLAHQSLQDAFGFGATLWTWRESCGDPHKAQALRAGQVPTVWGEWDVRCIDNRVRGPRSALLRDLARGWVRAAPGRLTALAWDPGRRVLSARGVARRPAGPLLAFFPDRPRVILARGLRAVRVLRGPAGAAYVSARPRGGPWRLRVSRR
jgi:endoglycosylceramidase